MQVKVVGGSGFVGAAVMRALADGGYAVASVRAPRLGPDATTSRKDERDRLCAEFEGVEVVINCAGSAAAGSADLAALLAANAEMPELLAEVAVDKKVKRLVHVSSAVVQGRHEPLDDSLVYEPFSAYAKSKIQGEQRVLRVASDRAVVYRPAGVHGVGRSVTASIVRLAGSPLSSVAGRQPRPVPQAYIENVASAIAFLGTTPNKPPAVVHHPSEGVTNQSLLRDLGARDPKIIPLPVARALLAVARGCGALVPTQRANVRRVELLWLGQSQARSWLEDAGWEPPRGRDVWREMGLAMRARTNEPGAS